eukprot:TRINITY_DN1641_c2_g1_i1.p1 TRINITY_DN1641_c2_g1~~TRINITY_DN1641_c2_g1_i1.p1  ORF type:complete len:470 (+),score=69.75 TRINITY_DN1641_c2_g1_i1:55-1464(+)
MFRARRQQESKLRFGDVLTARIHNAATVTAVVVAAGEDGRALCMVEGKPQRLGDVEGFKDNAECKNFAKLIEVKDFVEFTVRGADRRVSRWTHHSVTSALTTKLIQHDGTEHPCVGKVLNTTGSYTPFKKALQKQARNIAFWPRLADLCRKSNNHLFVHKKISDDNESLQVSHVFASHCSLIDVGGRAGWSLSLSDRTVENAFNNAMGLSFELYFRSTQTPETDDESSSGDDEEACTARIVGSLVVLCIAADLPSKMYTISRCIDGERQHRLTAYRTFMKENKLAIKTFDKKIERGRMQVILSSETANVIQCTECGMAGVKTKGGPHKCPKNRPAPSKEYSSSVLLSPSSIFVVKISPEEKEEAAGLPKGKALSSLMYLCRRYDIVVTSLLSEERNCMRLILELHVPYFTMEPRFLREDPKNRYRHKYLNSSMQLTIDVSHGASETLPIYCIASLRAMKILADFCNIVL